MSNKLKIKKNIFIGSIGILKSIYNKVSIIEEDDFCINTEDIDEIDLELKKILKITRDVCLYAYFLDYEKFYIFMAYIQKRKFSVNVIKYNNNNSINTFFFPSYSNLSCFIKRLFDILVSLFGIIVFLPIWLAILLFCSISTKGSPIFKQNRITQYGKIFEMYKFRSMYARSEEKGGAHWTHQGDMRITKFGSIIRKFSIDEFAQLLNVLKGDMSLIGPRPERPELVEKFIKDIDNYELRHLFKAGMSGWAQVNGLRGDTSLKKRVEYDVYYLQNWSILFDLKIFVKTFIRGFKNENAY